MQLMANWTLCRNSPSTGGPVKVKKYKYKTTESTCLCENTTTVAIVMRNFYGSNKKIHKHLLMPDAGFKIEHALIVCLTDVKYDIKLCQNLFQHDSRNTFNKKEQQKLTVRCRTPFISLQLLLMVGWREHNHCDETCKQQYTVP